jgi:hypothetical protein
LTFGEQTALVARHKKKEKNNQNKLPERLFLASRVIVSRFSSSRATYPAARFSGVSTRGLSHVFDNESNVKFWWMLAQEADWSGSESNLIIMPNTSRVCSMFAFGKPTESASSSWISAWAAAIASSGGISYSDCHIAKVSRLRQNVILWP